LRKAFLFLIVLMLAGSFHAVAAGQKAPVPRWPACPNPIAEIIIVGIDGDTLYNLGPNYSSRAGKTYTGPYPIERNWYGALVNQLRESGAQLIAFDQVFRSTWETRGDQNFAAAVKSGPPPVIVGFDAIPSSKDPVPDIGLRRFALPRISYSLSRAEVAPALALPFNELINSGTFLGSVHDDPDPDGVLRRSGLFIRYNGMVIPSLPLMIFLQTIGVSPNEVEVAGSGPSRSMIVGGRRIPLGESDTFTVSYPPTKSVFQFFSFYNVVKVKDDFMPGAKEARAAMLKKRFRGKVVIVGYQDASLGDLKRTPAGGSYPGVEAVAATVNQLLNLYAGSRQSAPPLPPATTVKKPGAKSGKTKVDIVKQ
jgi:CHASE2 domain-containing sensor protein